MQAVEAAKFAWELGASRSASAGIPAVPKQAFRARSERWSIFFINITEFFIGIPGFDRWRCTCSLRFRTEEPKFGGGVKKIQTREFDGQLVLQVAGKLAGGLVSELDRCWEAARAKTPNCRISIDLNRVTRIDQAGWRLLQSMHASGVDFVRAALAMNELWSRQRAAWKQTNTREALHA
jgi:hypothetical protein